jgi:hypothetical protein
MLAAEHRALLQHDLHALGRLVLAVLPALEGRAQEASGDLLVLGIEDPVGLDEDPVLQHRRTFLVEVDDHEVVRLHAGVQHLLVLVVGHGRRRVDLLLEQ